MQSQGPSETEWTRLDILIRWHMMCVSVKVWEALLCDCGPAHSRYSSFTHLVTTNIHYINWHTAASGWQVRVLIKSEENYGLHISSILRRYLKILQYLKKIIFRAHFVPHSAHLLCAQKGHQTQCFFLMGKSHCF